MNLPRPARIKGTNHNSYRPNEWAVITGVNVTKPEGLEPRAVFECIYPDGKVDYIPVSDVSNYEIG